MIKACIRSKVIMNLNASSNMITVSYSVVSSCIFGSLCPEQGLILTLKNLMKISFRFRLFLDL